jgi:hypothetical protein
MTDFQADPRSSSEASSMQEFDRGEKWPEGTGEEDRICWVCEGPTFYRQCKIICQTCGFMRDCSDP